MREGDKEEKKNRATPTPQGGKNHIQTRQGTKCMQQQEQIKYMRRDEGSGEIYHRLRGKDGEGSSREKKNLCPTSAK